jgi:DNA-binding phage protein
MRDRSRDEAMAEAFREDPSYAIALLNDILSDGPSARGEALIVLRQMAKAFGGVPALAASANLNQNQIYRMLSDEGNPTLESLTAILDVMGLRLAVQAAPKQSAA